MTTLVLVVEDDPVGQAVLSGLLRKRDCVVEVAGDGIEALEKVGATAYAVVFMDCRMPRMDGYEATAEIRRREGDARRTPVVAVTASEDLARFLAAGMDAHMSKPVLPEVLDRTLARWA